MKTKSIALIGVLLFTLSLTLWADEVTKKTLPDICPKLEIKKYGSDPRLLMVEINIPANEVRFKRLFQAWFIITDKEGGLALRVPIQIREIAGMKQISVDATPEMLKNAKIVLDCKMKDSTINSLDTVTLVLPSLLDINN